MNKSTGIAGNEVDRFAAQTQLLWLFHPGWGKSGALTAMIAFTLQLAVPPVRSGWKQQVDHRLPGSPEVLVPPSGVIGATD